MGFGLKKRLLRITRKDESQQPHYILSPEGEGFNRARSNKFFVHGHFIYVNARYQAHKITKLLRIRQQRLSESIYIPQ